MQIVFVNAAPASGRIPRAAFLRATRRAQKFFGARMRGKRIGVAFVSAATSKKLNRRYRARARPTSVLSFASADPGELGDIVICASIARKEANDAGTGFKERLAYLFAHGLLHLLGMHHRSKKSEQRMEAVAEKMLNTK
ncbi:MAG: rRNA maturation RNase YbeY [Parcubacteria group bacterium]|nr:rRNA maturation RNase YbeY [Parcubacteria group bacterium]